MMLRTLLIAASSLTLAACVVGPKPPVADLPPSGTGAFVSTSPVVSREAARNDWWRLYDDPTLDRLVTKALTENNELEAAVANLQAVRATLRETRVGGRVPRVGASAGVTRQRQSSGGFAPGFGPPSSGEPQDEFTTYDAGLDLSYEVDLWGRITSAIRAARADSAAAEAALDVVRVQVAAETARAYADACALNLQIATAERSLELQTQTAELVERQLQAGTGNGLDVARARSAVASTAAALPPLRAAREAAVFRLATLTGETPATVDPAARACTAVPELAQPIPTGDGAALLARRPDVRRAERELVAAAARTNLAVANVYPRITLGATAGSTALALSELGRDENFRFSFGPLISWSVNSPGASLAAVGRNRAQTAAALARFDQTVLVALQETETALSTYAAELDRARALTLARDRAAEAARLSRLRFEAGSDSFLSVLDAERTLTQAESQLAASRQSVANAQVTLFKALAGGWRGSEDAPTPTPRPAG